MPEMRGDKLINQIQFMDSSCKFIVMTGYSVEDEVQQILAANPKVFGIMHKPLDLRKLVDVIERANNDQ
jgi:DNA-binding NtrC family response regulator